MPCPPGSSRAIYLNEYAVQNRLVRIIRLAIRNLSGVPSIVYGLFGFTLFIMILKIDLSVLAGGLTLGLLTLPWTITASEEALKTVPMSYREGALALGATKWQTIRTNVLPYAVPGMLTGTILGLARAAGETAPILFTGAAFFWPLLPSFPKVLTTQFMALPYHLFIMATQHHDIVKVRPIAYGTAAVLIALDSGHERRGRVLSGTGSEKNTRRSIGCRTCRMPTNDHSNCVTTSDFSFYYGDYQALTSISWTWNGTGSRPSSARPAAANPPSCARSTG